MDKKRINYFKSLLAGMLSTSTGQAPVIPRPENTISDLISSDEIPVNSIKVSAEISSQSSAYLYQSLGEADPEVFQLIKREAKRQFSGLELIASENYTSVACMEANGSILTNKYSEGLPGSRYYGGNDVIDEIERLCQQRALALYELDPSIWGVNVQPYSGSGANLAVYTGLLNPHDRIMGLDLPSGGHLTHGYQTAKRKISATSIFFESMPYQVDPLTGLIDYESLAKSAHLFHPKMIVCGASAYPRDWDYERLRKIADEHGAFLLADIAHVSGLVGSKLLNSPFGVCDVVTTTTHKTLRGPRAGLIFFRVPLAERVNSAVFPGTQGGPHNNTIAAIAVALKQAASPEFRTYAKRVRENAQTLANCLKMRGYKIATDGTDNHIVLWDLRPLKLTGSKMEKICDMAAMTLNKNCVPGDSSAISPGGIRIGTAALTTRGLDKDEMQFVALMLHKAVQAALRIQDSLPDGKRLLKDFCHAAQDDVEITTIRNAVETFASQFPMPGYPMK